MSLEQYLTYTTEKPEKSALEYYVKEFGNFDKALEIFSAQVKNFEDDMGSMVSLINLYRKPLDRKILEFYHGFKMRNKGQNVFKILQNELELNEQNLEEYIENTLSPIWKQDKCKSKKQNLWKSLSKKKKNEMIAFM